MRPTWIRQLFRRPVAPTTRRSPRLSRLEALEDRAVPSGNPPFISFSSSPITSPEGTTITRTGFVGDNENDPLTVSTSQAGATFVITGNPGPLAGTQEVKWTYTPPDGLVPATTNQVTVSVNDGTSTTDATFNLTVTNVTPVVTAPANQVAITGKPMNINLGSFTDPGADANWSVAADLDGDGTYETTFTKSAAGVLGSAAFTYPTAKTYTASLKVTDKDLAVSSVVTFNVVVSDTVSPTYASNTFTETANTSGGAPGTLEFGDTVTTPFGTAIYGYNAWPTIQQALDVTTAAGTTRALAGTYPESLTISKAVSLLGPNVGVSVGATPGGTRAPEAIVTSPTANLAGDGVALVRIMSSSVTLDGLTLDGDNTTISGGTTVLGGADSNARRGVEVGTKNVLTTGVVVQNSYIKNFYGRGVQYGLRSTEQSALSYSSAVTTGTVTNNAFSGIGDSAFNDGYASLSYYSYPDFTGNAVGTSNVGPFYQFLQNSTAAPTVSGNTITAANIGLGFNQMTGTTPAVTVTSNTVVVSANDGLGVQLTGISNTGGATLTGNSFSGSSGGGSQGLYVTGTPGDAAATTVSITGGSVSGFDSQLYLSDNETSNFGAATQPASLTVSGVAITVPASGVGVNVVGTGTATATVTLTGNTTIAGGASGIGVKLSGQYAKLGTDTLGNTAFTGFTGTSQFVVLASGAYYDTTNSVPLTVTGTAASYNGVLGSALTTDFPSVTTPSNPTGFQVEDRITHFLDTSTVGFVRTTAATVFVTTNTAGIQRGVTAAAANDSVDVQAGGYSEDVTVPKAVKLYGPNATVAGSGSRGTTATQAVVTAVTPSPNPNNLPASAFTVAASGVEIRGFEIKDGGIASAALVTDYNLTSTAYSNTVVQNNTFSFASANPGAAVDMNGSNFGSTVSTGLLVDANLITGATTGVNLSNGDAYGTVSGNTLTGIKSDGVFADGYALASTATLTISGNSVTLASGAASGITLGKSIGIAAGSGNFVVSGNTVTGVTGATGLAVTNSMSSTAITVSGNTVSGSGTGILFDGVTKVTSTGDTVNTSTTGLLVANTVSVTGTATVTGLTAAGNATGVSVTGNTLALGGASPNTITGTRGTTAGSVGVSVTGGTATLRDTTVGKADTGVSYVAGTLGLGGIAVAPTRTFTFSKANSNGTDLLINPPTVPGSPPTPGSASNVTLGNNVAFAGTNLFIDNESATAFDLVTPTGITYYSQATSAVLSAATLADDFRIEDRIKHKVDDNTLGLVTFVAGTVFVTAPGSLSGTTTDTDSNINRGIGASAVSGTVKVEAGSYSQNVLVNKSVTLLGAGEATNPSVNSTFSNRTFGSTAETTVVGQTTGPIVDVTSAATVRGFDLNGNATALQGVRVGSGVNSTTVSRNFVRGLGATGTGIQILGSNTGLSLAENTINNVAGVTLGIDLSNGVAGTVSDNVTTGFAYGIQLSSSNSGSALTISGNRFDQATTAAVHVTSGGTATGLNQTTLTNNSLTPVATASAIKNDSVAKLNAAGNYLGTVTSTGITAAVNGTGGLTVTDISPFLYTSTNSRPAAGVGTGFAGDFTKLGVTTQGIDATTSTGRITEGLNALSPTPSLSSPGIVHALAGTYNVPPLPGTAGESVTLPAYTTLQAEGAVNFGNLSGVSTSILATNGQTVTVGDSTNTTFSGAIFSSTAGTTDSFVKVGTGNLTLDGSSTTYPYAGAVSVNAGTLTLAPTGGLGTAAATASVASGAILADNGSFGGSVTVGGTLSGTGGNVGGNVTVSSGGLMTMTGTVGGTLGVNTGGTVSPAGTNGLLTVTGAATIAGTYAADIGANQAGSDQIVAAGFTLTGGTFTGNVTATSGNYTVFTPLHATGTTAAAGTFSGIANAQFVVFPTDTQNFRAFYNFVSNDFQLLRTPNNSAPTTVVVNDNFAGTGLGQLPTPTASAYNLSPGAVGYDVYPDLSLGVLSAPYFGTVNVYTGTYNDASDKLGVNLFGGKTIKVLADTPNTPTLPANTTTVDLQGPLSGEMSSDDRILLNRLTFSAGGSTASTFGGVISNTGTFRKTGTGNLTLTGANTYSGPTQITGGTLTVGADGVIPDSSAVSLINSGSTLDLQGHDETIGSLAGDAGTLVLMGTSVTGDGLLTAGGNNLSTTFGGVVSGKGRLVKQGTGTLAVTGANTYTVSDGGPATVVAVGTLQLGNGGTAGSLAGGVQLVSGKLAVNRSDTVTQATLLGSGLILDDGDANTQDGGVVQTGPGTLTLTAGNTYAGGTLVSGGTLNVSDDTQLGATSGGVSATGAGKVTVTASLSTARMFTLGSASQVTVSSGQTLTLAGGTVIGGSLRGPGTVAVSAANLTGVVIAAGATVTVGGTAASTFTAVTNSGTLTVPAGKAVTASGFVNAAGGRTTVYGTLTADGLTSSGYLEVSKQTGATTGGQLVNAGSSQFVLAGGGVLNIGYTSPTTGGGSTVGGSGGSQAARTARGLIDLGSGGLRMASGSVLRNNGFIDAPTLDQNSQDPPELLLSYGAQYFYGDSLANGLGYVDLNGSGGKTSAGF